MEQQQKVRLTKAMIAELREPLDDHALGIHPTKPFLTTIKSIYIVERLNKVFGVGRWDFDSSVVFEGDSWVVIKGKLDILDYDVVVPAQFGGNNNSDVGDAYKGAVTDALNKCASYLEIGIDVYKSENPDAPSQKSNGNKKVMIKQEHAVLVEKGLSLKPNDSYIKSFANGLKKYGSLTDKQLAVLKNKIAQAEISQQTVADDFEGSEYI